MKSKTNLKTPQEGELLLSPPKSAKYHSEMGEMIVKVASEGGHVAGMCKAIGIRSRDTFYRWINEHKEFKQAYEESKLVSQSFYEDLLLAGAVGRIKNFNFPSIAMILNNKFSNDYKRSGTGGSNTEINIGSIQSIEKLDSKGLDERIEKLNRQLGLLSLTKEVENNEIS